MNQRHFSLIVLLLLALTAGAQDTDFLVDFNKQHLERNRLGMGILGTWALGNIAISSIGWSQSTGSRQAFHQMNVAWNGVNLLIAGFGYYSALNGPTDLSLFETIQEHEKIKRILLFNAGLDLAYMAGGLYLLERGKHRPGQGERWRGFGRAVIMNGAFLFAFDVILYYLHQKAGLQDLYPWLKKLSLSASGQQLGINWCF